MQVVDKFLNSYGLQLQTFTVRPNKKGTFPNIHNGVNAVYFLIKYSEIVYVGKTKNISRRLRNHVTSKRFEYAYVVDAAGYEECSDIELLAIGHFGPILNSIPDIIYQHAGLVHKRYMEQYAKHLAK